MSDTAEQKNFSFTTSYEDLCAWLELDVTKEYMESLRVIKHNTQVALGDGLSFDADRPHYTHATTAQMTGIITGLNMALENVISNIKPAPVEEDESAEAQEEEE